MEVVTRERKRLRWGVLAPLGLLATLLTGAARAADPSFAPAPAATTGACSAAVADVNRDGAPDLALADCVSDDVIILLGSGKGRFTAAPAVKVCEGPGAIAAADFNGDGKPDLAVPCGTSKSLTILLGNGAGGFTTAPGSSTALGSDSGPLTPADLNGDGNVDLTVPVYVNKSWQVSILLGDGSGGFLAAAPVARFGRYGTDMLAIADFNGDGKADLAVANTEAKGIFVLLGTGGGRFGAARNVASRRYGGRLVIADFNRDGRQDLVGASGYSDGITVLLGTGAGTFRSAAGSPTVPGHPHDVLTADFNGDSNPDLAVANTEGGAVSVLLGNGAGRFRQAAFSPFMTPAFAGVGDFNGDGKPDLLAVSSSVTTILFQTPATPRVVGARAIADADAVFSVKGRVKLLAADGSRAAVTTSLKKGCGRIVIWRASSRTSSPVNPGFLGCDGDGVTQLAVGDGRVGWIEEGGGNNLEMTVMTAKLGGGAAKQIEYEANGDRAGGDPSGDWVGHILGGGALLAYNSWTQTCDRGEEYVCGEDDPLLRVKGEQLVRITGRGRLVVSRGPSAYPLAAVGGGRMAVEAAGAVTVRSASGVQIASVPDPERSARAVALSRTRLAIERTFTLDLYNPATGEAAKSIPLGPAAGLQLVDVRAKLALLRGPRRIVLVRLSDGKLVSFQPRPGATALVGARLTESGLFYAYNTRSRARPGRIVFAPTRKLLRRF